MRAVRKFRKVAFIALDDQVESGYNFRKKLADMDLKSFENVDVGDIVGVEGPINDHKKGELSIETASLKILTKALRPLRKNGMDSPMSPRGTDSVM